MEPKTTNVNGIHMRWLEQGEGYPVVYIHGIPTCPRLWRHVVPHVQNARSLAWEMVGYGASIEEGRNRDITVSKQADYLIEWMQTIGLDGAVLVGHDLGGGVAQIAAVRHRDMVRGLVLMNAVSYDSWPIPSAKLLRALTPLVKRFPRPLVWLSVASLIYRGHDSWSYAKESMAEHWQHYDRPGGAEALVRQIQSLDVQDTLAIADHIPHLNVPARLVWGAADQFQNIGYGYRLAYELGAPIDRIEGGKHFVPEDHPEYIAAAVNNLLTHVRGDQNVADLST